MLIEPIQGEAGVRIPPPGYLAGVRALTRAHRALFLADEIQSGLGRTGRTLACEHEDVVADVYLLGKALGGGIVPVSAVVADADVLGVLQPAPTAAPGGNPLACAAGSRGRPVGHRRLPAPGQCARAQLRERLDGMLGRGVVGVRSRGLWAGVDIDLPWAAADICARRWPAAGSWPRTPTAPPSGWRRRS